MSYDIFKDKNHPIGANPGDPKRQGEEERRQFGEGNQKPWLDGEPYSDYIARTSK